MNKENLLKLAKYLTTIDQSRFNMLFYRANCKGHNTAFLDKNSCGTAGCALGWAPFVEGLEVIPEDYRFSSSGINFSIYGERIFDIEDGLGIEWDYLFSGGWQDVDPTPIGAAERIIDLVENTEDRLNDISRRSVFSTEYYSSIDAHRYFKEKESSDEN